MHAVHLLAHSTVAFYSFIWLMRAVAMVYRLHYSKLLICRSNALLGAAQLLLHTPLEPLPFSFKEPHWPLSKWLTNTVWQSRIHFLVYRVPTFVKVNNLNWWPSCILYFQQFHQSWSHFLAHHRKPLSFQRKRNHFCMNSKLILFPQVELEVLPERVLWIAYRKEKVW